MAVGHPPSASEYSEADNTQKRVAQSHLQVKKTSKISLHRKKIWNEDYVYYIVKQYYESHSFISHSVHIKYWRICGHSMWDNMCWHRVLPYKPFREGLTVHKSLQGLPPMRRSNGPHFLIWELKRDQSRWRAYFIFINILKAQTKYTFLTYMIFSNTFNIIHMSDGSIMVNHGDDNRLFIHFRRHIFFHFKAKFF